MKNKIKDNNMNNIYKKVKKYRIAQKIVSGIPGILLGCALTLGLAISSIPLSNILYEAGIISENVSIVAVFGFPVITLVGGIVTMAFGIDALSNHFENKKNEGIKELMELSKQKGSNFDRTLPKTKTKIEKEIKEYTSVKNNQIMAKVNFFASVAKDNKLIKQELEEEWKIYLFDKISQEVSDELIKEIIFGLMLLNSNNSIEKIYEKLPKNITVLEALIYFSPKGEELEKVLSELDDDIDINNHLAIYTTLFLHK